MILQLQSQLPLVALASAEQRSRARVQGAHVRAQGWASSRWAWPRSTGCAAAKAAGGQRRARRRAVDLPLAGRAAV